MTDPTLSKLAEGLEPMSNPQEPVVTQADRDAAADLIEAYWGGADASMMKLAQSYRAGHAQGVFPRAFARHRLSHSTAQVEKMREDDGWISFAGGDCPVDPDIDVEIKTRGGSITTMRAGAVLWNYASYVYEISGPLPSDCQVIAYRALPLPAPEQPSEDECAAFRRMDEWDQRDETVLLLVDYSAEDADHALDDALVAITIGHNNDHNVGDDEGEGWKFAGWCWSHDHYVEGKGRPIGWMPLPHHLAALASRSTEKGGE